MSQVSPSKPRPKSGQKSASTKSAPQSAPTKSKVVDETANETGGKVNGPQDGRKRRMEVMEEEVKSDAESEEDYEDEKKPVIKKKKGMGKPASSEKAAAVRWTAEELKVLFRTGYTPTDRPNWKQAAELCPGRSAKSCSMGFQRVIQKKVEEMLKE